MSASDDNDIPLASEEASPGAYRAIVRDHRKKRRDSKMTAKPPGLAVKALGRPAIFGDTTEIVKPRNPFAAKEQKPKPAPLSSVSSQAGAVPAKPASNVSPPISELSIEDEISENLIALYDARKFAEEEPNAAQEIQHSPVPTEAPPSPVHASIIKRTNSFSGSLNRKQSLTGAGEKKRQADGEAGKESAAHEEGNTTAPVQIIHPAQKDNSTEAVSPPEKLPAQAPAELERASQSLIEKYDIDNDGALSADELKLALASSELKGMPPPVAEASKAVLPPRTTAPDLVNTTTTVPPKQGLPPPEPSISQPAAEATTEQTPPLPTPPRRPRYKTELVIAGTESGIKSFTDSYGRHIEAYYSKPLTLPDQLYLTSQDGQFAQGFQLCEGEQYWGARHDENGKMVARMLLSTDTAIVVGQNLLSKAFLRLDPSGDRIEQIRTPAGMKETIHYANERTAKKLSGNSNLRVRYCEYTATGWLLRRDDYMNTGVVESSFFDANMRVNSPERRLRALTRVIERNGIREKSHEEFTYHPEKHQSVRIRGSYTDSAGKLTEMQFIPGENTPVKFKIIDTFGFVTQLSRIPSKSTYEGTCSDRQGTILEDAVCDGKTITYTNRRSGASRTEPFQLLTHGLIETADTDVSFQWNSDLGRSEVRTDNGKVFKYPTGRVERIEKEETVVWEGEAGERSFAAPSGEVLVTSADGSAIRMHRNFAIEMKEGISGKFASGALPTAARDFAEKHKAKIDLRDFAEFVRQWHKQPDKLEAVLRQLDYLVVARYRDVPLTQVENIRDSVMHHIAYPEEIFQGNASTSGAAVAQRLFATDLPARYAAVIKEALTGRLTVAGSEVLNLNLQNMLLDDMSGRDAASRIFQTLIQYAAFHPEFSYENSWTGEGEDADTKPGLPRGIMLERVCHAVHRLSGVDTCIVEIRTVEELQQAYALSGKRSIIIAADGNDPPLGVNGSFERQLFTVMGIIDGRLPRALVCNQLGAKLDHSTRKSSIDAKQLLDSMLRCSRSAGEKHALAIIFGGQHGLRYMIENGKLVPLQKADGR